MKQRLAQHWPLLIIVFLAIFLRLPLLNGSFWMDEAAQALESARPWSKQLQIRDDFQPPLLHLLVAGAIRVNDSEWWLRTWGALIPGLLTIIGSYFLAFEVSKWIYKDRFGPSLLLASLTALLLATSSFHIFYSQELRQYSLPAMWGIWSWWVLIKMFAIQLGSRSWWRQGLAWVILSTLGLYSSYLYPFLLISQFVWIAWTMIRHTELASPEASGDSAQKNTSRPATGNQILAFICPWLHWLTLGLFIILAFWPWIPSFIDQLTAGQLLRLSLPGWETVVSTPQLKAIALVGGKFLFGVSDITPNPYFAIYTLMFFGLVGGCGYWFWRVYQFQATSAKKMFNKSILLFFIAFFVPLIAAWLVSFIVPVLQPKRVLYLLPFWYLGLSLLITVTLANFQSWKVRIWPLVLLCLLLIFNLGSTLVYWLDSNLQRENWRQAWIDIDQTYGDNTPKLFLFDGPFASWAWYDGQFSGLTDINDFSFIGVRTADPEQASSIVERSTNQYSHPTIIYFDYLTDLTDPDRLVLAELQKRGYSPAEILDYPNIGFVRIYRK